MSIRLVRFAQSPAVPWKNGLGVTTQLAIHPEGATADLFEWRVSIARLEGSAAFSVFHDVERLLVMLKGEMTLLRESHASVTLTEASAPVSFSGTVAAQGRVLSGPAFDLNLMYVAGRWNATMRRLSAPAETVVPMRASEMFCSKSSCRFYTDGECLDVEAFDLLRTDRDVGIRALNAIDGYMIELRERHS